MEWIVAYHHLTEQIVRLAGSDKLVHVHAGLIVYVCAQVVLRTRRANWPALQAVMLLEGANEALDQVYWGSSRWGDTLADIIATLLWPTVLYTVSRYRRARWEAERSAWLSCEAQQVATLPNA